MMVVNMPSSRARCWSASLFFRALSWDWSAAPVAAGDSLHWTRFCVPWASFNSALGAGVKNKTNKIFAGSFLEGLAQISWVARSSPLRYLSPPIWRCRVGRSAREYAHTPCSVQCKLGHGLVRVCAPLTRLSSLGDRDIRI